MEADVPTWADNLRWVVVAVLLALAYVGPKIFGPILEKWKQQLPASSQTLVQPHIAVVGAAFADRDALLQLTESINRLCDLMDARLEIENQASQEAKARKMIQELLRELRESEQVQQTREKRT